jgi:hypothetical protein
MLMASGFFLGTISIDDEINFTSSYFDGIGRGSWGLQLVTYFLPGQLGISFAPIFFGCALYALSTTVVISLWNLRDRKIANISAAIIGCFPYFASMMSFDVVQVAYPIGFVLITFSLLCVFEEAITCLETASCALCFALAFSLYQGVAASFVTVFITATGIRLILNPSKNEEFRLFWFRYFPRSAIVAIFGVLLYLGSNKIAQQFFPHHSWGVSYKVIMTFDFFERSRLKASVKNNSGLLLGASGDLPQLSALIFFLAIILLAIGIFAIRDLPIWKKVVVFVIFCASVFVLPFWLVFVQSNLLAPRSMVGLGVLYGFVYAAWATVASPGLWRFLPHVIAFVWLLQFIFLGNEMYYIQYLVNTAEQATVHRIAGRLDTLAAKSSLPYPLPFTIVGRYAPSGQRFKKFSTLGHSPLDWDSGNIYRQAAVFQNFGIDGIKIETDSKLRKEIERYVQLKDIPPWPHPASVFTYSNKIAVVNFGGVLRLEKRGCQSVKPEINLTRTKDFFNCITKKKLGNTFDVELKPDGIFVHPGGQPTEVVFQIGKKFQNVHLVAFINKLPDGGLADPLAGTVGVELFIDGKSQGHRPVDRLTNQSYSLDLTQAKELKVVVDCANGSANWDHFHIGIAQEAKAH